MLNPKRIFIIGLFGSGKSTFGKKLAKETKFDFYELDNIFWEKKYTQERPQEEKIKLANQIAKKSSWIVKVY